MLGSPRGQSGQVLVLVAVAILALVGITALALLAGNAAWQRNQLQALADSSAIDAAMKVGIGCSAGSASTVITEADNFVATQRTRAGSLAIAAGTCATPYHGTDTFAGGLSADYYYPYNAHQQQVEVVLTLALPISFGGAVGRTSTNVTRYAVAQALPASMPAVTATSLACTGGQVNVAGDVLASSAITLSGGCALYAHQRTASGAYSSFGNIRDYTDGAGSGPAAPASPERARGRPTRSAPTAIRSPGIRRLPAPARPTSCRRPTAPSIRTPAPRASAACPSPRFRRRSRRTRTPTRPR
jgi:hypothetical protein